MPRNRRKSTTSKGEAAKLYVGTSGWSYGGWNQIFYPKEAKTNLDRLSFYARHFNAVEVNYSFYHLPKPETYERWAEVVHRDFLFAVKASRFITHIQRLKGSRDAWSKFLLNARTLGRRLGPILFQLPPSFRADFKTLSKFLELLQKDSKATGIHPVFEFRHQSWFAEDIFKILHEAKATLCIAHSERYPCVENITANLVYFRFHGPKSLFASRYSEQELRSWARRIRPLLDDGKEIYIYFNNDFQGYAVENARSLRKMIEEA